MKIILLSDPQLLQGEHEMIRHLFDNELEYFHLRKPDWSIQEIKKYIDLIPEKYHNKIIIHDHFELMKEYRLKGVHFNKKNRDHMMKYRDHPIHKSVSTHSFHEILELQSNPLDYVFLSPIFDSISKEDYKRKFDPCEIKTFFNEKQIVTPVIALGGVSINNIDSIKDSGFSGIALLGELWNRYENTRNIKEILSHFNKIKQKCQ